MMSEEKQKKMKNKRNLFFILLIASFMALSCFIIATATDEKPQYTLGDVHGYGKITSTDYLRIKKTFLNEYTLEGTAFALADVDFNNVINSTDYLKIKCSILSDVPIDNGELEKFADKKVIEYCSSPSVFSPSYYANMLGRDDVYLSSDTTEENSDEKYYDDIFSYDAYSGLFVVVDSPFEHPQQITESFADGQTVTLNYNSFSMFPTGEYQHSYYCYQKETELTPSALYYVYTDKNGNIVGKRFIHFEEKETDKEILSENEIINLAKAKKEELGFSEFTLSSVNKEGKNYTLHFEKRINNLKTPDYLFLSYDKYGVLTEYSSYVGNGEEYDLRGFNSISDKNIYSNVIKAKGNYLLRNFQCECLSSKNPNDYIFSFEITEYFISYDGKMCAKAHVIYDSIDETKSHDHTFTIYFYVLSEEHSENETSSEDESFYESSFESDFSKADLSYEYIENDYQTYVACVGSYMGNDSTVYNSETGVLEYDMRNTQFYKDALNYDALPGNYSSNKSRNVPIFKFESKEELDEFAEKYNNVLQLDLRWAGLPSFEEVVSEMNEKFFENKTIVIAYVETTSGGSRFEIKNVDISKEKISLHIEQTQIGHTEDMSGHFMFFAAPKEMFDGVSAFNADVKLING